MVAFSEDYLKLLIIQYYDKPKARATIIAILEEFGMVEEFYNELSKAYDLDTAIGAQLDVLGRIVGMPRSIPFVVPKRYFGFADNPRAGLFADQYNPLLPDTFPFRDSLSTNYTDYELDDNDYRFFIRLKIAKNHASAYLGGQKDRPSIQEAVMFAFQGMAYVIDGLDMSMTLYVDRSFSDLLTYIFALDLLPRPQGVFYRYVFTYAKNTFGFADNPNAKGFADQYNPSFGGVFAEKVII
jgi:RNAse (barnase) inhibitor barstar